MTDVTEKRLTHGVRGVVWGAGPWRWPLALAARLTAVSKADSGSQLWSFVKWR